ncbi:MAG TPA: Asp-tRNA(Asn)/Glu-tRNA(Gln) amidotransferase subunit GatC [Gemmatimonadaceae bacterium]|nr:Asp-tRNA(Asn)/Glu-tRNA(Gln) amidotransferase subunit GatC [Gemmatimonadaceae bacterium]
MTIDEAGLRRVAALARLRLAGDRLHALSSQVGSILEHMAALQAVDTANVPPMSAAPTAASALRADDGEPLPLAIPRDRFAPAWRDGFFLVPRVASHEGEPTGDA